MTDEGMQEHITVSPQRRVAFRLDDEDDRMKIKGDASVLYNVTDFTPLGRQKNKVEGYSASYDRKRGSVSTGQER